MPFFPSKTKKVYNQALVDLTLKHVALGEHYYLPYSMGRSVTKISQYSCYLYLNLLTRFINFTKDLSEHELKIYLVRAEYRYFRFMSFVENGSPPPLDVAVLMQAHKAHPCQFQDDCHRNTSGSLHTHSGLNLQKTIEFSGTSFEPNWDKNMEHREPYNLTNNNLMVGSAEITCVVCFINIQIKWEDYVKWRTDAAALECNHCKTIFTRHHIGKANLILDLRKSMETDDSSTIKSTIGKMHLKIKKHVRSVHDIQALPFNSGLDAIKDYLVNNQKETGLEDDGCIDEFIETAKQSYFQSPYIGSSFDLLKAVAEQYKFLYKVTQTVQWKQSDFLKMIDNYEYYLELSKRTCNVLVPDIKADIVRHVHMTSATFYQKTTLKLCGKLLDHNSVIAQGSEIDYAKKTQREWNLSVAKRMQNKATATVGSIVNGISGEKKIQIPASESGIATSRAKGRSCIKVILTVQQCHNYDINEASYYQKDGFKDFENLRFMSDYMKKRIELLASAGTEWTLSDETIVIQTNGGVPELTVKRARSFRYYPFTADDPNFNWRDANKAWSMAFKDARNYNYTRTRLYKNKSFVGSMLIDFEIIFSNEIAFKKREIEGRKQAIKEARRINEYKSRKEYSNRSNGRQTSSNFGVQSNRFEQDFVCSGLNNYALYGGCDATNDTSGSSSGCNDSSSGCNDSSSGCNDSSSGCNDSSSGCNDTSSGCGSGSGGGNF